jgi:two-component system response regulator YesN
VTQCSKVCRVVIVDDEPEFREWLRSLLDASATFRLVGEAVNGSEAIRMIDELMPDLVIADVFMPDLDGLEIVQYIHKKFPAIKLILTSACHERVYSKMAIKEGALCFIPKLEFSLDYLSRVCQDQE